MVRRQHYAPGVSHRAGPSGSRARSTPSGRPSARGRERGRGRGRGGAGEGKEEGRRGDLRAGSQAALQLLRPGEGGLRGPHDEAGADDVAATGLPAAPVGLQALPAHRGPGLLVLEC